MPIEPAQNGREPPHKNNQTPSSETTPDNVVEKASSDGDWDACVPLVRHASGTLLPKYHPLVGPYESD